MKSVRRIAALLIFLMIAPPAWAMACATACAMESQHMSAEQTSDSTASVICCDDDMISHDHSPVSSNDCGMAAACHFAASAALSASPQVSLAINDTHFALLISSAPRSADTPPPFKPPA